MKKSIAPRRLSARTVNAASPFGIETLEQRAMLTADFGVEFDNFNVPATLVPGDRFIAGIIITNNGPMTASGSISIQFYLSTDVVLSSDDIETGSYPNQMLHGPGEPPIAVDEELTFADDFTVPSDAEPGTYFLLARIIPSGSVGDNNQSNNIVASDSAYPLEIKFGTIPGRTGTAILQLVDNEGTVVQFQLTGGGVGTVSQDDDGRFDINVTGAGANSQMAIATSGGDGVADLDDVNIAGSLQSFHAPNTRLLGSFSVSGTLTTLVLGDVGGTAAEVPITIGQAGVETIIELSDVVDASISTPGAIASLAVESWVDTNASPTDLVQADWITALTSEGNFGASLLLSGRKGGATLGTADIGGSLTGGSWRVIGRGGDIVAFASTARWSASFTQVLNSFTTERVFRGTLAAKTIQSVSIGLDLLAAKILAGANLGSDGRLGGTGDAADTFALGNLNSFTVGRRVRNSIVGAGLDPVNGIFNDGDDTIKKPAKSKMGPVTIVGTMAQGARIVGGRFTGDVSVNGALKDPAVDVRFRITDLSGPTAQIVNTDLTIVPSIIRIRFTDNVAVSRASIGDGDIRIDGPDNLFSLTVELVSVSRATDGTPMVATYRFTPPGGTWDPSENGSYTVMLLAGEVTDSSGNTAGGGIAVSLGTFDVLV